jgi:alginate O-acetyltransferase complex protein AlgI
MYVFLPFVMIVYYSVPKRFKNVVLLLESLLFYAWGEPVYIIVILLSTIMDYIYGRLMDNHRDNKKIMKLLITISVVTNVGILAVFKYSSLFVNTINSIFSLSIPDPKIPLPIGISFSTFQSMSYTIDLYMGNIVAQKSLINFCTYVTMFPQLVAGPIVRYTDVQDEIGTRRIDFSRIEEGVRFFVKGLAKKVLLANNIGAVWSSIQNLEPSSMTVVQSWFGILCFTFQIFFDFSGYSDMAVGLGKMLGFDFPQNFNYPYLSKSISEFWRRWHITLGMWFRSFVYIPLGGNRCSVLKQIRNLLIVWALTGLWHGASWNFVLWGLYSGLFIILEKFVFRKFLDKIPSVIRIVTTFILVVFSWVLFEHDNVTGAFTYYGAMFGVGTKSFIDSATVYQLYTNAFIFIVCALFSTTIPKKLYELAKAKFSKAFKVIVPLAEVATVLVCTAFLVDASYNPFLYFRF